MQRAKLRLLSAITTGSLTVAAVVAITVGSGSGSRANPASSHTAQPVALAAQTASFPPVNIDDCPTLQAGYPTGGCVAQLQTDLNTIQGNHLTVDGTFGPVDSQTYDAVTAFQQANNLQQDGVVGLATKQALDAALSVPTPTVPPATAPATGASTAAPASGTSTTGPSTGETLCKGWGGVLNNIVGAGIGSLSPAILGKADLGTPYLDGNVVRADSSVPFSDWGSCGNQVAFQMQSWVCGLWGCEWVTRNHGIPEFFWAHDDTGVVARQVTMACRPGTHSYRVHMQVIGLSSTGDVSPVEGQSDSNETEGQSDGDGGDGVQQAIGVHGENESENGPAIQLTC